MIKQINKKYIKGEYIHTSWGVFSIIFFNFASGKKIDEISLHQYNISKIAEEKENPQKTCTSPCQFFFLPL